MKLNTDSHEGGIRPLLNNDTKSTVALVVSGCKMLSGYTDDEMVDEFAIESDTSSNFLFER